MDNREAAKLVNEFEQLENDILNIKKEQLELAEQIAPYFKARGSNEWTKIVNKLKKEINNNE